MKKICLFLLILIICFFNNVHAKDFEDLRKETKTNYSYEQTQKIIKEVMKDYYIRGANIQYHNSRRKTPGLSPEEATSQDRQYHVCSAYAYNSIYEAFKMTDFPRVSDSVIQYAREYYKKNKNNSSQLNDHFLIYYESTTKNTKDIGIAQYAYNNKLKFSDFVNVLRPGDVLAFTGHVMMVYDKAINPQTGKMDVLLLNSNGGAEILSRLYSTRSLFYNYDTNRSKTNVVDVDVEGGIQYKWLSNYSSRFVKEEGAYDQNLKCRTDECVIIRPFYKSNDGKTVFNFSFDSTSYLKSLLRTKYPGLKIEKTVNKGDNNSVYLGDTLTYTINITNKSSATNNGKESVKYDKFTIKETFNSKYVDFVKADSDCTRSGSEITCVVNGLEVNKTKTITYSVKVKNSNDILNEEISSTGVFYGNYNDLKNTYIDTGTVVNKIIPAVSKVKDYKACYDKWKNKGRTGLDLINHVYSCDWTASVWTSEYDLNNFDFTKLFKRVAREEDQVVFNTTSDTYKAFYDMILNNYWSAATVLHPNNKGTKIVPLKWKKDSSNRKYTFNETDFKNGDILIYYIDYDKGIPDYDSETKKFDVPNKTTPESTRYTKEKGYYAYIYIDGKFVGVNGSGATARNEFTYEYYKTVYGSNGYVSNLYQKYNSLPNNMKTKVLTIANYETLFDKDYYIILRPEIVIASKTQKTTYPKGDVDGDGKTGSSDYVLVRKHILKQTTLTGDKLTRADLNSDNKISSADYVAIRKIILNK